MKLRILLLAFSLCMATSIFAQKKTKQHVHNQISPESQPKFHSIDGEHAGCMLMVTELKSNYYNPAVLSNNKGDAKSGNALSLQFDIDYIDFTPEAQESLQFAFDVLSTFFSSPVPVRVQATYANLGVGVLGGATFLYDAFSDGKRYPSAVIDKLAGLNVRFSNNDAENYDIVISINNEADWHLNPTDSTGIGNKFDLATVMMHEIIHGMGFSGRTTNRSENYTLQRNEDGEVSAYDSFIENGAGVPITDLGADGSDELKTALTSRDLFFNSPALDENYKIHAPLTWAPGTSYYHLDETVADSNDLMTPFAVRGKINQDPGVAIQMLYDMGWDNTSIVYLADDIFSEDFTEPFVFNPEVFTDSGFDTSSFKVVYSQDSFMMDIQEAPVVFNVATNMWEASIPAPNAETVIHYRVELIQSNGAKRQVPADFLTLEFYTHAYVVDTVAPEISHADISSINSSDQSVSIKAIVSDNYIADDTKVFTNIGAIDSVYAEYRINNDAVQTVGMAYDADGFGSFRIGDAAITSDISSADVFQYRILARDSSAAGNIGRYPADGSFIMVPIVDINDPAALYTNDFNTDTSSDFSFNKFEIALVDGFDDGALTNSEHPYVTAGDDGTINYSAVLNTPIIIADDEASAFIKFKEIVLVEVSTAGTVFGDFEFWDYVIIEAQKLSGGPWEPLLDGYDSRANLSWEINYVGNTDNAGLSSATPVPGLYKDRELSLLGSDSPFVAGDTVLVRFRLFSDPAASGWGWMIDNLNIQDANTSVAVEDFVQEENQFQVFPNPSSTGQITVLANFTQGANNLRTELTDMYGRLIRSEKITNGLQSYHQEIDISSLPAGIYFMTLRDNESAITKKVVKY